MNNVAALAGFSSVSAEHFDDQFLLTALVDGRLLIEACTAPGGANPILLAYLCNVSGLCAYGGPDFDHVIVVSEAGTFTHLFFKHGWQSERLRFRIEKPVAIAGLPSESQGTTSHLLYVADAIGNLWVIRYAPANGIGKGTFVIPVLLAKVPLGGAAIIGVSAFASAATGFNVVTLLLSDGRAAFVEYDPAPPLVAPFPLVPFLAADSLLYGSARGLCSFEVTSPFFGFDRHVVLATTKGIFDFATNPGLAGKENPPAVPLANPLPGELSRLSGYLTRDDNFTPLRVAAATTQDDGGYFGIGFSRNAFDLVTFDASPLPPQLEDLTTVENADDDGQPRGFGGTSSSTMFLMGGGTNGADTESQNGLWRMVQNNWRQLPQSPPNIRCVAVDPARASHVVVGTDDGPTTIPDLNSGGVWESSDSGNSWQYVMNPLAFGCTSQRVDTICFSRDSVLFAGTQCFLARETRREESGPAEGRLASLSAPLLHYWTGAETRFLTMARGRPMAGSRSTFGVCPGARPTISL